MIKTVLVCSFLLLGILNSGAYSNDYYNYSSYNYNIQSRSFNNYQISGIYSHNNSMYNISRTRYQWVPIYKQEIIRPAPSYGFPFTRQPSYRTVIEWNLFPVTRY